jgi:hypothetical protein
MKKSLLIFGIAAFVSVAYGGPEQSSNKETSVSPCPSWYADNEWNLGLWGAYAFTDNRYPTAIDTIGIGGGLGKMSGPSRDRYLEADHAWGGGIDAKYFFRKYFGIGLQGFGVNARRSFGKVTILPPLGFGSVIKLETEHEDRVIGGVLGTFTLRYPIGCSRVAPYVWIGGGAIFGGGEQEVIGINDPLSGAFLTFSRSGTETKLMGQAGGGFEVRLTPHVGWINDFSWNFISGGENNFGMARTGINFAF